MVASLINLTIETSGTEEEAEEGLAVDLDMDGEVEEEEGSEGEEGLPVPVESLHPLPLPCFPYLLQPPSLMSKSPERPQGPLPPPPPFPLSL